MANFTRKVLTTWIYEDQIDLIMENKVKIVKSGFLHEEQLCQLMRDMDSQLCKELMTW